MKIVKFSFFKYLRGSWQKWTAFFFLPLQLFFLLPIHFKSVLSVKDLLVDYGEKGYVRCAGSCAVLHQTTPWGATGTCRYSGNTLSQRHWLTCCIQVAFQINSLPPNHCWVTAVATTETHFSSFLVECAVLQGKGCPFYSSVGCWVALSVHVHHSFSM